MEKSHKKPQRIHLPDFLPKNLIFGKLGFSKNLILKKSRFLEDQNLIF